MIIISVSVTTNDTQLNLFTIIYTSTLARSSINKSSVLNIGDVDNNNSIQFDSNTGTRTVAHTHEAIPT